ncbi:flagellin [Galbitalea soli]|uniref:Flagellin n=1 Tax=Galbitalea soli TaxID=1268042 RepID=A0A7C9TRA3_9MICO|nr:flagellin [Galbitalea soli]NEM91162.1 flagellar hook-associated protein 3 [Galbitalea soli]NYJ29851.1 flagellar hook-associated protein 3 FlgL [Galbitalea soli]
MLSRLTSQMMMGSSQRNLQLGLLDLNRIQQQGTSQKTISKPSDDPAAMAASLAVRAQQRANDQYTANVNDGSAWLATLDNSLGSVSGLLRRVQSLTVQGSNSGAMDQSARDAIATEIDSIKQELMGEANTTYLGRTVYAGNSDAGVAFNPDYSFTGSSAQGVQRRISATTTVTVDADGSAVFGTGSTSAFALLDTISSNLRSGTDVSSQLDAIASRLDAVTNQRSIVGAKYNQLTTAKANLVSESDSLESTRSSVEDVDLSKVVIDLKTQETNYQSALAVTARALQPSLMSFLQ